MTPRLGILGGTFDPPHVGHLLAAWSALEALALDEVVFVPAAQQPLKAGRESASAEHRLAMTRLLVGDERRLAVDAIELERGGLSYTVDTMRAYRAARPDTELHLLLGEDAAALLGQWKEPQALTALVRIAVLSRDGEREGAPSLPAGFHGQRLRTRRVEISSTEIRSRARAGLPLRGFVTDAVAAYIATHQLYRPTHAL